MDQCKKFCEKGVIAKFVGEAMTVKCAANEVLEEANRNFTTNYDRKYYIKS